MDRLLIAEDEKLIRQGLRAMIQRSDVPIGEILECRNGEEALKILRSVPVDVLFTDVRMLKMDGLTLIRAISEQEDWPWPKPEIVVISGYDDFNYAVEAMRYGSREYILKPVKRERVFDALRKLENIIAQRKQSDQKQAQLDRICRQHIKYTLANPRLAPDELETIKSALSDLFTFDAYVVLCANRDAALADGDLAFQLESGGVFRIMAMPEAACQAFVDDKLKGCHVGASASFSDLADFRAAFEQAVLARKYAFFTGKRLAEAGCVAYHEEEFLPQYPPAQLARRIGSKHYQELVRLLNSLHAQAARARLYPHIFEEFMLRFLESTADIYGRFTEKEPERMQGLKEIYGFDTVDAYRMALLEWLDSLNAQVYQEAESTRNSERIRQAIEYIESHYGDNLNMAVVSNYISMNYSVFSQLFKEYARMNFVDYLRSLRIEKAKELLVDTGMKISEISDTVGFESDKYFMKSFKTLLGVSPSQYRKTEQIKKFGAPL